jgi:hypothetical protein
MSAAWGNFERYECSYFEVLTNPFPYDGLEGTFLKI